MQLLAPGPKFPPLAPRRAHALLDVPVSRGSVGAMALAAGVVDDHSRFKPYIYRGKGFDQYDAEVVAAVVPPKPPKKRRKQRKPKPRPRWRSDDRSRLNDRPRLPSPPYAPPTYWPAPPEPVLPVAPAPKKVRAAVGWQPTSGADIEALLDELDG